VSTSQRLVSRSPLPSQAAPVAAAGAGARVDVAVAPPPARAERLGHRLGQRGASAHALPPGLHSQVEQLSGLDLSNVRVHRNSSRPAEVGAHAYTQGNEIHLGPGQDRHLAHELWHVVQQRQGRVRVTTRVAGRGVNADAELEREADVMGARALQRVAASPRSEAAAPTETTAASPSLDERAPLQRVSAISQRSGLDADLRDELNATISKITAASKKDDDSERHLHKQFALVDGLEHRVYDWHKQNRKTATVDQQRAMFDLLDDLQAHHKTLVRRTVEQGASLWVKDPLDAAGRAGVDQLWGALRDGQQGFTFPTHVHTADGPVALPAKLQDKFKVDTLSALARLISRPRGRSLVQALHDGSGGGKGIDFALPALPKLRGTDGYQTPYVGAQAVPSRPGSATLRVQGDKRKNQRLVPGPGSGTGVLVAPGIKDSSLVDFDSDEAHILSPAFIGVGHELIHGAHYQRGTYVGPVQPGQHAPLPAAYGGDIEEFATIAPPHLQKGKVSASFKKLSGGSTTLPFELSKLAALNEGIPTEAEIRAEHGLDVRHGHESTANPVRYASAQRGENPGEHVRDAIEWLGRLGAPPPPRQAAAPVAAAPVGAGGAPMPAQPSYLQQARAWFSRLFS